MANSDGRRILGIGLVAWLIINVLQAGFTPVDPDEAYYLLYAQHLDWGYFDHPPMLAVFIALGSALFKGVLGLRLFIPLLQAGAVYGVWLLAGAPRDPRRALLLLLLLAAMPMFEVYGFIAAPDAPLLFFTVAFFLAYRQFLAQTKVVSVLALGAVMAALLYSKYHGVLIIFFTLFSNVRLLRMPSFYIAAAFGALLFFPHLYWQYTHDFPSFRYHLQGRNDVYELKYTTTYLINQVLIFSPLLFPWLVTAAWKRLRVTDKMQRAYVVNIIGFWTFFLWATSKGHVEPQWTCVLAIPLTLLVFDYSDGKVVWEKWLTRMALISIAIVMLLRLALVVDAIRPSQLNKQFFHRDWVEALEKEAGGDPIVFQNSYRLAAVYAFYTGKEPYNFTDANYRKSQFDLWDGEKKLQGKQVLLAGQSSLTCDQCRPLKVGRQTFSLLTIDTLMVTPKVSFLAQPLPEKLNGGQEITLEVEITNPYPHTVVLYQGACPVVPMVLFFPNNESVVETPAQLSIKEIPPQSTVTGQIQFEVPAINGAYHWAIGLKMGPLPSSVNSFSWPVGIQ